MKILIDTNIYLDFYRASHHSEAVFELLEANYHSVILTDQIVYEFDRNREAILLDLKRRFNEESKIDKFASLFLLSTKEFKSLRDAQDEYNRERQTLLDLIDKAIREPSTDSLYVFFNRFVEAVIDSGNYFTTSDEIVHRAEKRKRIGNPPISNKFTIGDEINWEMILENISEDIILVGRDDTYTKNFFFLQKEFHKKTGFHIAALESLITDALDKLGVSVSESVKQEEHKAIDEIKKNQFKKP